MPATLTNSPLGFLLNRSLSLSEKKISSYTHLYAVRKSTVKYGEFWAPQPIAICPKKSSRTDVISMNSMQNHKCDVYASRR